MKLNKSKKSYHVKAPAKINIGLRILKKRKDGYHDLETIFYPVKIFDTIKLDIEKLPGSDKNIIKVNTLPKGNISGSKNICFKAAELFFEKFNIKEKYQVTINIRKNIPLGAGLGGGSSDAASMLKILYKHYQPEPGHDKLSDIAKDVGSDVPFFLLAKPAYALGRGEILTPLPKFKVKGKILIVNPGIHVSTPLAFKELGVKNYKLKIMDKMKKFDMNDKRLMINDFEKVVFKKYPVIEKLKYDMFSLGADYALMSGSGSTVYGVFSLGKIKDAEKYFRAKKYKVFVS